MTDIDQALEKLRASLARADAMLPRADGPATSGKKTLYASDEIDLGKQGWGEVEYHVTAQFKFNFDIQDVKSIDWNNEDKNNKEIPRAAISAALRKIIARDTVRWLDKLLEQL